MRSETRWGRTAARREDPPRPPGLIRLSDWGPRALEWLWEPLIPRRKVTLLVGDQELGKTFFALDLAARLSRGAAVPPDGSLGGSADALILSGDDDMDDTLFPRLQKLGADLDRIYAMTAWGPHAICAGSPQLSLANGVEPLHDAARQLPNCRLIVIDPITAFLEGMAANSHAQVRRLLQHSALLAKVHDAAVLIITHHSKSSSRSVLDRTLGCMAFTLASRVVLTMVPDPATVGRRLLLPAKMNLLPLSKCPGRAFAIEDGRLEWDPEPVFTRPDELQRLIARGLATSERTMEVAGKLKKLLAEGPRPSQEIHQWADREQIPRVLLFQAKSLAGIESRRDSREQRWCWQLPEEGESRGN